METEYKSAKSTYILKQLINDLSQYDGIIFYSILQLPELSSSRHDLFKKILKQKKQLHFALENIVASNKEHFVNIEKIFLIKSSSYRQIDKTQNGQKLNLITENHLKTKRNYLKRANDEKIKCMKIAKKFSKDYWDGNRKYGYGGYTYIEGYYEKVAKKIINKYSLTNSSKILDIGCGKGFLLFEIKKILNNITVVGIDISKYAKLNAKKEIKQFIQIVDARKKLNYHDKFFDLAISINTLHNFSLSDVHNCLKEMERVSRSKFICVESYRNEKEQFNVQCWALTAETIIDTKSWIWMFNKAEYSGDYEFIFFE